jgi:hypothetical protein
MKKLISSKFIQLVEDNAQLIAQKWCESVKTNANTPTYHSLPEKEYFNEAYSVYRRLGYLLSYDIPRAEFNQYFIGFIESKLDDGFPLSEIIYALILMRRHIWLFIEREGLLVRSAVELQQAMDFDNRVILIFDRAMHIASQRYESRVKLSRKAGK